jgi:hypothetical protein
MTEPSAARSCPWCAAPADAAATKCDACGAALAQRDDLDGLVLPGVTDVHPALRDAAGRPMRAGGPSATQGIASAAVAGVIIGGPIGVAAVAGVAAVGAAEYLGARRGTSTAPTQVGPVGTPGEAARTVAERLDEKDAAARSTASEPDPGDVDGSAGNSDNSARD